MGGRLRRSKPADIRRRVYELLEQGPIGERRTRFVSRLIILMIVVNLVAAALETVPALEAEHHRLFVTIEWLSLVLFTAEYLARVSASLMYIGERHVEPDNFGTMRDAMWWAIVTLGTIGYGDVVPMTPVGKLIAAVTIFCGLVMVALPVGIIATAFSEMIHRRDFVVTWGMIAKVPLFA